MRRDDGMDLEVGQVVWEARPCAEPVFCKCCEHQTHLRYRPRVEKYRVLKKELVLVRSDL